MDRYITRTTLRSVAALLGQVEVAQRFAAAYPPYPDPDHRVSRMGEALTGGAEALARGDPEAALRTLAELRVIDGRGSPFAASPSA